MMKTNTKYIFFFSFILLAAVSVGFWYVRETINKKIDIVSEYRNKEFKNKNLESSNLIKDEMALLNSQEEIIKKYFLNSGDIVNFIREMESTAQNLGVVLSVEKIDYGTPEIIEEKYNIKPIILNIQLIGSFENIELFSDYLKKSESNLSMKEFKLYKSSGEKGEFYTSRIIIEGTILSYD